MQGYVFAARPAARTGRRPRRRAERCRALEREAEALRERFEAAFWCEELGTYALALDGAKRPCRVRSSNAGQCLFTGIVERPGARAVAQAAAGADVRSRGWGVRTLAASRGALQPDGAITMARSGRTTTP